MDCREPRAPAGEWKSAKTDPDAGSELQLTTVPARFEHRLEPEESVVKVNVSWLGFDSTSWALGGDCE
jgi:hypothetical protein